MISTLNKERSWRKICAGRSEQGENEGLIRNGTRTKRTRSKYWPNTGTMCFTLLSELWKMISRKHFLSVYDYFVHWIVGEQERPVRDCWTVQSDGGGLDHTVEMERGGQSPDLSWEWKWLWLLPDWMWKTRQREKLRLTTESWLKEMGAVIYYTGNGGVLGGDKFESTCMGKGEFGDHYFEKTCLYVSSEK